MAPIVVPLYNPLYKYITPLSNLDYSSYGDFPHGFPNYRVPVDGIPITRIVGFGGLCRGPHCKISMQATILQLSKLRAWAVFVCKACLQVARTTKTTEPLTLNPEPESLIIT